MSLRGVSADLWSDYTLPREVSERVLGFNLLGFNSPPLPAKLGPQFIYIAGFRADFSLRCFCWRREKWLRRG
jgi:hypothetical protein